MVGLSSTEEFKRDCLARWVLDTFGTRQARRESLGRMEGHHGKAFVDDLKRRIILEIKRRKCD